MDTTQPKWHIYTMDTTQPKKSETRPSAATCMDPEMMSEAGQKEKDKYHVCDSTCTWDLKSDTKVPEKQKQSHRHREQSRGYPAGGKG